MPGSSNDHEHYVSSADWLVVRGRDDLIDEIADQVERRPARPASPTPTRGCRVPDWHVVC